MSTRADLCGTSVYGVGLRQLAYRDCGIEFLRGQGGFSLVKLVCSKIEVLS